MHSTLPLLEVTDFPAIDHAALTTLQVNLGYRCNQRCLHCHVNASPERTEMMAADLVAAIPLVLRARKIEILDLTGGAPELHPQFRELVIAAREQGVTVYDRCNLTILSEPRQENLAQFLAEHQVVVIASLPCYSAANTDAQRGAGVFERSIAGLQQLNKLGYGIDGSGLALNLVYNPVGPSLPPSQVALEPDYKRELREQFGVVFNQLFTLANMPINRFGSTLISKGQFNDYMALLKQNQNHNNLAQVMCRSQVSVDWQGQLYDCDFNQQLHIPMQHENGETRQLKDLLVGDIQSAPIRVADHCYGCIAGSGSSCGGALS